MKARPVLNISEFIQDRDCSNARRVGKPSVKVHSVRNVSEFTLDRNCQMPGGWESFSGSARLTVHQRIHHGEKPCHCKEHGRACRYSSALNNITDFTVEHHPKRRHKYIHAIEFFFFFILSGDPIFFFFTAKY